MSRDLVFEPTTGSGTVWSFTINRLASADSDQGAPVVAQVEMDDQAGLILLTNLVGIPASQVTIGLTVHAEFEHVDDVWIPVFSP